jgi:hypothetical protein
MQVRRLIVCLTGLCWAIVSLAQTQHDMDVEYAEMYAKNPTVVKQRQSMGPFVDTILPEKFFIGDQLRTEINAYAKLQDNSGDVARIDQKTTVEFKKQRQDKGIGIVLKDGSVLLFGNPITTVKDNVITGQDGTGKTAATPLPPEGASGGATNVPPSSAYFMSGHDGDISVYALTDTQITTKAGQNVNVLGGQTVNIKNDVIGNPAEFNLTTFYRGEPIAAGLGPGQETLVYVEPSSVQRTLLSVRKRTLAAIENQYIRISKQKFLSEAIFGNGGGLNDPDTFRGQSPITGLVNPQVTSGTFTRTDDKQALFQPNRGNVVQIDELDFKAHTVKIDGKTGTVDLGPNGNSVSGTVIFGDGSAKRFDVRNFGGKEPPIGATFPGTLSQGIAPDR